MIVSVTAVGDKVTCSEEATAACCHPYVRRKCIMSLTLRHNISYLKTAYGSCSLVYFKKLDRLVGPVILLQA